MNKKYVDGTMHRQLKGHRLSVTCVVISNDGKYMFSSSKDGSIIKCSPFPVLFFIYLFDTSVHLFCFMIAGNFETGMKMNTIKKRILSKDAPSTPFKSNSPSAHTSEILCLALTDDFKFLVSN